MPKIEIELDDETLLRVTHIAQSYAMSVENWLTDYAERQAEGNPRTGAWEPFSTSPGLVRLILLVDWDPMEMFEVGGVMHEYDRYASEILSQLEAGISQAALAEHLDHIIDKDHLYRGARPDSYQVAGKLRKVFAR